jgi:hypothetical protein
LVLIFIELPTLKMHGQTQIKKKLPVSSTYRFETAGSVILQMLINVYHTARYHNPVDGKLHSNAVRT